jgi:hypothetical protein
MWPKEDIPDNASVFMRIHKNFIVGGDVTPNTFRDQGPGMSVDWNEYSTPLETRNRARTPSANAVISMIAAEIRKIDALTVEHTPIQENSFDEEGRPLAPNRAHSEVIGQKTPEVRVKLSRIWAWEIRLAENVRTAGG